MLIYNNDLHMRKYLHSKVCNMENYPHENKRNETNVSLSFPIR